MESTAVRGRWIADRSRVARTATMVVLAAGLPWTASGQSLREGSAALPRSVVTEVLTRWNAPGVRRVIGALTIGPADTVRGDLAVLNGPVRIAGVLAGRLLVVNGSVFCEPGAVVTNDVLVVGGTVEDRRTARIDGELRVWRDGIAARVAGDSLFAAPDTVGISSWDRWKRAREERQRRGDLFVASTRSYNRVEGLPILFGPRLKAPVGSHARFELEALGIVRTGDRLEWTAENRGYRVRSALSAGERFGVSLEGTLFDEVSAVEPWTLREAEIGLGTLLFTRDYADYYGRKGAALRVRGFVPGGLSVSVTHSDERWQSRAARDVWSLLDRDRPFRVNPRVDDGRLHVTTVGTVFDTRNDTDRPQSGWMLEAQFESGVGRFDRLGETSAGVRDGAVAGRRTRYGRLFADLRRYNRLAPHAQLNMRVVVGTRTGGALPLQRRFSVSGIDAVPGFTFRSPIGNADLGSCSDGDVARLRLLGAPAQCDGMALVQLEWKGEFSRGVPTNWPRSDWIDFKGVRGAWVLFVDSGRGWLSGEAPRLPPVSSIQPVGTARYRGDAFLPRLGSFRTDVGAGLDLGGIGVYVAAPVSSPGAGRTPTVFLRTGRRF